MVESRWATTSTVRPAMSRSRASCTTASLVCCRGERVARGNDGSRYRGGSMRGQPGRSGTRRQGFAFKHVSNESCTSPGRSERLAVEWAAASEPRQAQALPRTCRHQARSLPHQVAKSGAERCRRRPDFAKEHGSCAPARQLHASTAAARCAPDPRPRRHSALAPAPPRTWGLRTSARAMAMRCFWPPLSARPFSPHSVS
jgi:hypothetical protein